jgi:3-hydroxyisobutyrate dehydrogenase-like beta-hydroxyacid dehydrogenase
MKVGFIGLGMMGRAMAKNLANAGHEVMGWNRSLVKESIDGVRIVSSPFEAFQSDVVFTMLSDDAAIREVVLKDDLLSKAKPGLVHIVTSTISIEFVEELEERHDKAKVAYISAPVFGRPDVAAAAQLNIMAAGAIEAVNKVTPLFDVLGKKTWRMGSQPRQANAAKIAGNMMIAMAIEAMSEAVAITGANGVAPDAFFELMTQTLFAGRAYENYSKKIAASDFEPGFKMQLGLKDLRLALAAGRRSGKKLPQLEAVHSQMQAAVDSGLGDQDWSAVAKYTLANH